MVIKKGKTNRIMPSNALEGEEVIGRRVQHKPVTPPANYICLDFKNAQVAENK